MNLYELIAPKLSCKSSKILYSSLVSKGRGENLNSFVIVSNLMNPGKFYLLSSLAEIIISCPSLSKTYGN